MPSNKITGNQYMSKSQQNQINEIKQLYTQLEADPENEDTREKLQKSFKAIFRYFEDLSYNPNDATSQDRLECAEFFLFSKQMNSDLYNGDTDDKPRVCGFGNGWGRSIQNTGS
jgi:hypothetical protein